MQIAYSISFATTIRIGNELGAGNSKGAKRIFHLSLIIGGKASNWVCVISSHHNSTVGEAIVAAVALQALKYQLPRVFTTDE